MENASKALIMAGAMLITVLLISITMYAYNSYKTFAGEASIQTYSTQAEAFNRFFIYSSNDIDNDRTNGIQIKGTDAYNIIAKVNDINNNEWSMDVIRVRYGGFDYEDLTPLLNSADYIGSDVDLYGDICRANNKSYTYSYTFNPETGLVDSVELVLN